MEYVSIPKCLLTMTERDIKLFFYLLDNGGQYDAGVERLAQTLKMTRQNLRTALSHLERASLVNQPRANHVPTTCQPRRIIVNQEVTEGYQPRANHVLTTNQPSEREKVPPTPPIKREVNPKKEKDYLIDSTKRKKGLQERLQEFKDELQGYISQYGQAMIDDFYSYWGEPYQHIDKFRKEGEKTWSTPARLRTWSSRDKKGRGKDPVGVIWNSNGKQYDEW